MEVILFAAMCLLGGGGGGGVGGGQVYFSQLYVDLDGNNKISKTTKIKSHKVRYE